jgi:hypothetical protein
MPEKTLLERNLLALSLYNPALAQVLSRQETPPEGPPVEVSFLRSRSGLVVPALGAGGGLPLHSTFHPDREGERFLELYTGDGFLLFLGLGAAYHIAPFLARKDVSSILIIDQSLPLLRRVLEHVDLHQVFLDPRVRLLIDKTKDEVEEYLLANYIPALLGDLRSIPLWPRFNAAKEYFKTVMEAVEETINKIADDYTVQAKFGKKWFVNTLSNFHAAERSGATLRPQKKAIVTGAGPSLEAGIAEIRQRRADHFLIASDTSLPCLLHHGLEPDCVISIDCQHVSYHHFLGGYPSHIPLLLDLASPPLLTRLSDKLLFFSSGHPFSHFVNRHWRSFPFIDTSGGNVSHAAVSLAARLGAREIRLYGVDFSYPEGKTYARGTYLYDYFQARETRFEPVESHFFNLIFKNKTVIREACPGYTRYTTKPLQSYKERMELLFSKIDASIIHAPVKGLSFNIPARPAKTGNRVSELFAAGPAESGADEFLALYRASLEELKKPFDPVINYLHDLSTEEREVWTTLMPVLASLRVENRGDALDGAVLMEKAREFAIERLKALNRT